jgi:ribosomal protein S17E
MNNKRNVYLALAGASLFWITSCSAPSTTAPEISKEGMQLTTATRSTIAYQKPGVNFSEYSKVKILPSAVAFKKNWERDYNRDHSTLSTRVRDEDVIRIKNEVATLFDEIFKEEFSNAANIELVENVSSNTLIMRPAIINLDVHAPDLRSANNVRVYTQEAGQATLFIELYDGVSGEILARILNSAVAGDSGYHQWATRVSNRADATRMIKKWANTLINKYDEVHMVK